MGNITLLTKKTSPKTQPIATPRAAPRNAPNMTPRVATRQSTRLAAAQQAISESESIMEVENMLNSLTNIIVPDPDNSDFEKEAEQLQWVLNQSLEPIAEFEKYFEEYIKMKKPTVIGNGLNRTAYPYNSRSLLKRSQQ